MIESDFWPASPEWGGPRVDLTHHKKLREAAAALARLSKSNAGAVVLAGHPGCGKTELSNVMHYAAGLTYRTTDFLTGEVYWTAIKYPEPKLLDDIRASYSDELGPQIIFEKINTARLLILDDIGAGYVKENSAEWYDSLLWRLLDGRTKTKKTIITTNLQAEELRRRVGFRCFSRLKEMMAANTERGRDNWINLFDVPDYRARSW